MGTQIQERLKRINELYFNISECSKQELGCNKEKLIAVFCSNSGLTIKKANEYIDTLIAAGKIEIEEGDLWTKN